MKPARRCSALFNQLCMSSLGGPTARKPFPPGAVSTPVGTRHCHPGAGVGGEGGVKGTLPQLNPSGAANAGALTLPGGLPHTFIQQRYSTANRATVTQTGLSIKPHPPCERSERVYSSVSDVSSRLTADCPPTNQRTVAPAALWSFTLIWH